MWAADHLTSSGLVDGLNPKLPDDQWLREFALLENNLQSQMRIALASYSVGLTTLGLRGEPTLRRNQTKADKKLCDLQRMQSPGGFV